MKITFPSRNYFEVDHYAFDALVQQHLGIAGFEAQRVFEWSNDSYTVATASPEEGGTVQDRDLLHFLRFVADTREAAIAAEKQQWRVLMAGGQDFVAPEPEPWAVLDRQLADYQRQGYFPPPLDAFLRELARRDIIPEGWYLISICW